jgi:hypothetical protein
MNWSLTLLLLQRQTVRNTEGVRRNKNQKPFEQHSQKAFLNKNTFERSAIPHTLIEEGFTS